MKLRSLFLFLLLTASLHAQAPSAEVTAEAEKGFHPLTAALHVHSRFSDGQYDISELTSFAEQRKIDVLGVTDSFLTRVRFGIGPFKKLFSLTNSRPGIVDHGIDEYLKSADEAQEKFHEVVVLPGLEVTPYYYWTGSWTSELQLHDFDRHMLIFGLSGRSAIANLPVIENATWANTQHDWLLAAGPITLFLLAVLCLILRRSRPAAIAGFLFFAAAVAWSYDAYPFGLTADPYSGKSSFVTAQRLIDYVNARGGISYWSYPEARYPDTKVSIATMISRSQPQVLALTKSYAGFEGIYGDTITITRPGNLWDRILTDYIQGGRKDWPSVITGIDFHYFQPAGGWYELNQGITVLFAKTKDRASVLDALKEGRGYASYQQIPSNPLRLSNFGLRSGDRTAISGETLQSSSGVQLTADIDRTRMGLESASGQITVELVRDGNLLDKYEGLNQIQIRRTDVLDKGKHYYRLGIRQGQTQILSNPIFCRISDQ